MSRRMSLWCTVALAGLLALSYDSAVALDRAQGSNESLSATPAGAPADYRGVPVAVPRPASGLDDMLQPSHGAMPPAAVPADASDLAVSPPARSAATALWQRLTDLALSQRLHAVIDLELGAGAGTADRRAAADALGLWNAGRFEEAIAALRTFEEAGGRYALGIAWKPGTGPAVLGSGPASPSRGAAVLGGGTDVRIGGTRVGGRITNLDFDAQTGHLFSVVGWGPTTGGAAYWTVNISLDNGATWTEAYAWYAGATAGLIDVSAAVVGDYVYVGYVPGDYTSEFRVRRNLVSNGASDAAYGFQTVLDAGTATFQDVALASNAEDFDNRIYCLGIQSDHVLRWAWDVASDGTTFTDGGSPAVANASFGLDAAWNHGYATYFLVVSYAGTDGQVHVQRHDPTAWTDLAIAVHDPSAHNTAVGAYEDAIICAYEYAYPNGRGIRYDISYDGGGTWNLGDIAIPDGVTSFNFMCPDLDARSGLGTAITYASEVGEPDVAYYRARWGYAPGLWSDPLAYNDLDISTGSQLTLGHLPRVGPGNFNHGAIYFYGGVPYFDFPGRGVVDVPAPGRTTDLQLFPPAPSPFADRASIRFSLPRTGHARLQVFDVLGREVATLVDGPMGAGTHSIRLEGRGLQSGVYLCRLTLGAARQESRFVVIH
jgi:hypothetical protein